MNHWFDESLIEVKAGNGGRGCESFNFRTDRKRVPNGGNGGNGGDIWIEADRNISGLMHLKFNQHFQAGDGTPGGSSEKAGRSGRDILIKVPCGTTIFNTANNLRIRDLKDSGDRVMVVKGGRGGPGNHTGKPSRAGMPGTFLQVRLDLKIVADVFLLGTPGAGKSALLNTLTHSKVPEKPYPFSTKAPQMGVYKTDDFAGITLCELPSLIQGSHEGHGVGNHYLKHLKRGRLLYLLLEPASLFAKSLTDAFKILKSEINSYDEEFLKHPFFCVVNKMDTIITKKEKEKLEKEVKKWDVPVFFISVKTGDGLKKLTQSTQRKLKNVW